MTRIEKVQKLLAEHHVQALIVDNPTDLYYLTGQVLTLGRLVVAAHDATLFVDGRYFEGCRKNAPCAVQLTASYEVGSPFHSEWKFKGERVGFDAVKTTYADYELLQSLQAELVPLKNPVGKIREIKEPSEIEALRRAATLGSRGMDFVISQLKEGVTEKEIGRALEIFWLKEGGDRLAFNPHISFGEGSSQPHYKVSNRPLKPGETVLIDIGVVLDQYHSDMTRVVFFGEPSAEMGKIYSIVHSAYQAALTLCRQGTKIGDVDRAARSLIEQKGYGQYFTHSLGHGVGLEIHESPRLRSTGPDADRLLMAGMVVTVEPGIYLPGIGGVRLEDTIVITPDGYENLTNRTIAPVLPIL